MSEPKAPSEIELVTLSLSFVAELQSQLAKLQAENDALVADKKRLDYLDLRNKVKNERCGSTYGWMLEENCNRIALTDHNVPVYTIRQAIDQAKDKP